MFQTSVISCQLSAAGFEFLSLGFVWDLEFSA
jgi:hypothetical protein